MISAIVRKVRTLVSPEAVLFAAAVGLASWEVVEESFRDVIRIYPYAVLATGLAFAWRFRRSRLFFALVVLALGYQALTSGDAFLFQAAGILVPLNLAAIAWLPERGAFSLSGLARWAALAAQVGLVVAVARYEELELLAVLRRGILAADVLEWSELGWPALVAFAFAAGTLVVGRFLASATTARGYLWALAAAFLAFAVARNEPDRILYLSTAGLIIFVAVLETSYRMAYHDSLTGLPGRRAFNEALWQLRGDYTVAIVDVDHFKKFNDHFGHEVGDQVLRMVAARLGGVKGGGRAFRYGGEEFALLFPGRSVEECLPALEDVRKAIGDSHFTVRRRIRPRRRPLSARAGKRRTRVRITVSVGVAQKNERHGTAQQVVHAADAALYKAKGEGRNRVRT